MKDKEKYIDRLNYLFDECSYDGWDGYNAAPISKDSYETTLNLISSLHTEILSHYHIFPGINKDISLEYKGDKICCFIIAPNYVMGVLYIKKENEDDIYLHFKHSNEDIDFIEKTISLIIEYTKTT